MRKTAQIVLTSCILLVSGWTGRVLAQETEKPQETAKAPESQAHFYRLEFVVQETDSNGKPTNSRTYSGTVSTGHTARGFSVRTGSKVPVATGSFAGESKSPPSQYTQFQYIDVGVNIDAHDVQEQGEKLALYLIADVSNMADTRNISGVNEPVIRQNKWQAGVLIPIGKATTVFTSDVLDSKGGMQLVVTATPVK